MKISRMDRFFNILHKSAVFGLIGATVFLGVQIITLLPGARETNRKQLKVDREEYVKKLEKSGETGGVTDGSN